MTFTELSALVLFGIAVCIIPGPNNIMLASTGAQFGIRRGMGHFWGVVLGFSLMVFFASLGLGSLASGIPRFLDILRVFAVLAIIWLSFRIMTAPTIASEDPILSDPISSRPKTNNTNDKPIYKPIDKPIDKAIDKAKPIAFFEAFIFQCINPKTWTILTSLVAIHWNKNSSLLLQASIFFLVFFILGSLVSLVWMSLGIVIRPYLLKKPKLARAFNIFMGVLLCSTLLFLFL